MSTEIQSLKRAFAILEYIAFHDSAGISEISHNMQINKSTVFSIVKTLVSMGYLYKNEFSNNYQMTYRLQTLAEEGSQQGSFAGYCRPHLRKLREKYDETIHLVSARANTVIYLDKLESNKPIRIHTDIGAEMPLHCTAVGKSILAWRSDEEIAEYVNHSTLRAMTPHTITDEGRLREELERIRTQGFSIDDEEAQENLYCIAMPVLVRDNVAHYAVSLSMPKYRKDELDLQEVAEELRVTIKQLQKFF